MFTPTTRVAALLALLLTLGLAACSQTEEANRLVDEMNALTTKGSETAQQAIARSQQMQEKDFAAEREEVRRLGRESASLFGQARDLFRQAADKAEQASRLKVDAWFSEYLSLKAQQLRKASEAYDLSGQEGQLAAGDGTLEEINKGVAELEARVAKLNEENEAITARVKKIEEEHKDDIRKDEAAK